MNVLIVGAGAVGQVYGRHFQRGGADVAYLVKPQHLDETRGGLTLYPLNDGRPPPPVRFEGFEALTEAGGRKLDAAVLCVSSPALRGGWLDALAAATGDATVVMLQPGLTDREYVAARVGEGRLVSGLIGFIAYAAPLSDEPLPLPGTAYWFPPFQMCPFTGAIERVRPIVDALRRGGFPARIHPDVPSELAFKGAVLETLVVALEHAGWSFAALRRDRELLELAIRASREVASLAEKTLGKKAPAATRRLRPWMVRLITWAAPKVAPFDLEAFFRKHFTKVGDQTRETFVTYAQLSATHGVPTPALLALARLRLTSETR